MSDEKHGPVISDTLYPCGNGSYSTYPDLRVNKVGMQRCTVTALVATNTDDGGDDGGNRVREQ
jgi:hypothetical protein